MKVSSYITPNTTGYAAGVGLCLTIASGLSKNRSMKKFHLPLSIATAICSTAHIGLIEYNKYLWKHQTQK